MPANNPANNKHGGVGLFYKNSLPVIVRDDLSFDESIVVELKLDQNLFFFTVLYRTPAFNHNSPEFWDFLSNFENLYSNIKTENPLQYFLLGILMHIPSFGGPMTTQLLKAQKSKNL